MGCMNLSGFLRAGCLALFMSASIVILLRKCRTRTRSNGKAWLSIFGVEGSLQNELITLLVTSRYLRAVVLLINWVLTCGIRTRRATGTIVRVLLGWRRVKERSRWWRSADVGARDWCYNYSIYFKCVAYTTVASPVTKSRLRHWHTTTIFNAFFSI